MDEFVANFEGQIVPLGIARKRLIYVSSSCESS
jgi:hypothetical protein